MFINPKTNTERIISNEKLLKQNMNAGLLPTFLYFLSSKIIPNEMQHEVLGNAIIVDKVLLEKTGSIAKLNIVTINRETRHNRMN